MEGPLMVCWPGLMKIHSLGPRRALTEMAWELSRVDFLRAVLLPEASLSDNEGNMLCSL